MTDKSLQQMKETLKKELNMYKEILVLAKNKTEFIKSGQLDNIEKTTAKEQQYIKMMGTFERLRRSIFVNIREELQIESLDSISELLLHIDDSQALYMDRLRDEILDIINELKQVNELNEKLITKHLEYVNFNIQLMTSTPEGSHYGQKDTGKTKSISSLLDMKI